MLDQLIRWSLAHRFWVLCCMFTILGGGAWALMRLPVEVLPDLTKPTVTILTESPGLAPEEVELQVTQPIEAALMGVERLNRLRSTSDVALSLVFVEFDWGTDIYQARQWVQERLQSVREQLPDGSQPNLTPVASLMGEILLIGVSSPKGELSPVELRTLADWNLRRRLQSISGISEILNLGGGVKTLHVQPNPQRMQAYGVSLAELRETVQQSALNTTGGFLDQGSQEIMVRNLAMTSQMQDLENVVVKVLPERNLLLKDIAEIVESTEPMRGDASINGAPGVIMSVTKSPGFDTLQLTQQIEDQLAGLQSTLPEGVKINILFRQSDFILRAIGNLKEAIRDGAIMVSIVLFLFLLNVRTTFITLMAIPLSFAITLLCFYSLGISVNSMTLGGLAVAIGMVVDDAIVDIENVYRRLRENQQHSPPLSSNEVIANASSEVRNSIFYATLIIILVFLPLLGLQGVEGRLFGPIAIATILSMMASFIVSLTVIPVLCSFLLGKSKGLHEHESFGARWLKVVVKNLILRHSLRHPFIVLTGVALIFSSILALYPLMGKDFLPGFHEETIIVTTAAAPGTSLNEMRRVAEAIENELRQVPEINNIGRRIGRAEKSDHVVPLSNVEFDIDFSRENSTREMSEILLDIRERLQRVPGSFSVISGPLGHRISHLLSGVTAPVAVKIFGDDLDQLAQIGAQIQGIAKQIPGLENARLDMQASIPQLRIEVDREKAKSYGITPGAVNQLLSSYLGGEVVTQLQENHINIALSIRLNAEWRENLTSLRELPISTANGRNIPLHSIAELHLAKGPNNISHEGMLRRFIVSITPSRRDAAGLVAQLQQSVSQQLKLPEGYHLSYEGEFKAQQEATTRIAILFAVVLLVILVLLYSYFNSLLLSIQVLLNLPLALMGSLALTAYLVNNINIASIVGLIAVGGVATRNGIMMISHYLHLMRHEGESFNESMILRGTLERVIPVTMTALSAGIALIPLLLAAGQPGKEILHPVAVCIVGGLISSTLLDFAVTPAVFALLGKKAAEHAVKSAAPASH